jgi:hypothetical protein
MSQEKTEIILNKLYERVDRGEFDADLNIPFASRKLLKKVINQTIEEKIEKKTTPVLSDSDIKSLISDVKETATITAKLFIELGIIEKDGKKYEVNPVWQEKLNH